MYNIPTSCQKMNQEPNSNSKNCQHSKRNEGDYPQRQRHAGSCDRSAGKKDGYENMSEKSQSFQICISFLFSHPQKAPQVDTVIAKAVGRKGGRKKKGNRKKRGQGKECCPKSS